MPSVRQIGEHSMENLEVTKLDRITIPGGADEYYTCVQSVVVPFLDAVMSGARAFDECSTRIENEILRKDNAELCDKMSLPEVHSTREIATIQTIALAIGTLADKSVLVDNPSALRIYTAILELAEAIRDVQSVVDAERVGAKCLG